MGESELVKFQELFLEHLKEYHDIDISQRFTKKEIEDHLGGEYPVPVSVFSDTVKRGLSPSEVIVKFLRENEGLSNSEVAHLLGKSDANVWITYRNARKKMKSQIKIGKTDVLIGTAEFRHGLSVLESVCWYLKKKRMRYNRIAMLLGRDERTVWTVCQRAKKKLER